MRWLVFASLVGIGLAYGSTKWKGLRAEVSSAGQAARGFIRVEDLPRAPFVRIEDLPQVAPLALRPLQPAELTPDLIRRANDMLRNHEKPLGTQVLVETRNKTYVARFEWHLTYDSEPDRPQTWHKGITLYATE